MPERCLSAAFAACYGVTPSRGECLWYLNCYIRQRPNPLRFSFQMANERFLIGILSPRSAKALAELIEHEKNTLAGAGWHDRWHMRTPLDWTMETLTQ
jgi:hypothetical protein